jgi:TolB-like protein/DNA-binding winged helix-turn-helix (wHTH) protein/tetratricopeptide (TPR) repeat protein
MEPGGPPPEGPLHARFDAIEVDEAAHVLRVGGEQKPLEPKAFSVLLTLLRQPGRLVGHDELLDAVWGHRHVTPGVVTRAISQLRAALGDDPHHPRYIQTQHALGYRFVGTLEAGPGDESAVPAPVADESAATAKDGPLASREDAATRATREQAPVPAGTGDRRRDPATRGGTEAPAAIASPRAGRRSDDRHRAVDARARQRPAAGMRRAAFGVATLLAAALLVLWASTRPDAPPPRASAASIVVLPFTSLSEDPQDRYFAEGLAIEMHDALAGIPGLQVAAQPAAGGGDAATRDPRELGSLYGVATVLDASVRREGRRVLVNARLVDTASGFTLWHERYDREAADVFALQGAIAAEVVAALPLARPVDRERLATRLAPTSSPAAYDLYLKGQALLLASSGQGRMEEAIGHFREALAGDPRFARAQAGICRAEIRRFEAARDPDAFARAQAACARAAQMDPVLREVDLALGDLARVRDELDQADAHYNRALDDVALRSSAYVGMARVQRARDEPALALDYFERARQLRPGDAVIHREIGYHHYRTGDLPSAIEAYRIASTLDPDDPSLWASLGGLRLASGDAAGAEQAFARSLEIEPGYAALSNMGTLRFEQGRHAEAADLFRKAAQLNTEDFRVVGNIGDALSAVPATAAQAADAYRRAAGMAERYLAIKADDGEALAWLAWYRANLGEHAAARELATRAEALEPRRGDVAFVLAQTLAVLGDEPGARERLARARELEVPESRIRASPALRALLAAGPTRG